MFAKVNLLFFYMKTKLNEKNTKLNDKFPKCCDPAQPNWRKWAQKVQGHLIHPFALDS